MKYLLDKIQQMLLNKKRNARFMAVLTALSIVVSFVVPYVQMAPGIAITEAEMSGIITSNMPDMSSDGNTNVSISTDAQSFGGSANAGNKDLVSIWLQVEYAFNIADKGVDYDQPSFYFVLENYDVDLLKDFTNLSAADSSDDWIAWRNENIGDNKYSPATYDVYQDENGKIYVVVELNEKYIEYIKTKGNNEVKGNVRFSADVSRDESQSGDKTIYDGEADLTVSFDDRKPSLNKDGSLTYQNDAETGHPIINWTITVTDFYELGQYTLSDTHLNAMIPGTLNAIDENGNEIAISASGNNFVFADETTSAKQITITYQSVATAEELSDTSNNHKGFATNTVSLNIDGVSSSTGEIDLNADFKAHISKDGKPSYEYDGSKGYIYWTLTVSRNYKGSLNGYVINDTLAGAEFVSATGADVTTGSAPWTISNHTGGDEVVIVYRTPVESSIASITNSASITPPNSNTPDDSKTITKNYDDTNLFTVNKSGDFNEDTEEITWKITIDATKNNSKETLNGYVIEDSAFSRTDITSMKVTAWNDWSTVVSNADISSIATQSDGNYVVNSSPDIDKIEITYTVPLTSAEESERNQLPSDGSMTATNDVTVTSDDNESSKSFPGTANVPSGYIGITAKKLWNGYYAVSDRTYPVTIVLQKRIGNSQTWTDVEKKTIASATDDQYVSWDKLPKKDDETGETIYYKVIEEVATGADYTVNYSNEYGVSYNSELTITNTWNNMAVSVDKQWSGDSGHEISRPETVRFDLYQRIGWGGTETATGKYAILTISDNTITYYSDGTATEVKAWTDLPRTDENGNTIFYFIKEEDVSGYTSSGNNATLTETGTITITNTADYFNFTAYKKWNDGGYTGERTDITFELYNSTDRETWNLIGSQTISSKTDDSVTWEWQPAKDADGKTLYYKVVETTVPENYTVSYSNEYITASSGNNQSITVTNTWENMNVHVRKSWQNVSESDMPDGVTFELWERVEGSDWAKVDGKNPVTVTAANSWQLENAWTNLPKTKVVNGVTVPVYYAAREVGTSDKYISTYDTVGINGTNWSTVTNKPAKITVSANKVWNKSTAELPTALTFHLEQSTDMGASWSEIEGSEQTLSDYSASLSWSDLPVQESDGSEILYRVVEDTELSDFTTSYSPAYISANSGNITVTNQQKANYSKLAVAPVEGYDDNGNRKTEYSASEALTWKAEVVSSAYDTIAQSELVSLDDEYYIFKWFIDISKVAANQTYKDKLPDYSTLYVDDEYPLVIWSRGSDAKAYSSLTDTNVVSYDTNGNLLTLTGYTDAYSYYVKIPKTVVDKEIEGDGSYQLVNRIKLQDETDWVKADITISNTVDRGNIYKQNTNDDSSRISHSKGLAIGDTRAYYTVDVNPEALYLSNNDYVTVKDVFKVLAYLDSSGELQTGYDLINADIENVSVYEMDNTTGKRTLLTSGYSYVVNKVEGTVNDETDLTIAYPSYNLNLSDGVRFSVFNNWTYKAGHVMTIKVDGEDGKEISLSNIPDSLSVTASSSTYVNGSVILTLKFLEDVTTETSFGIQNASSVSLVKYVEITETPVTQHVATFTIPDGKHIVIEYEYLLTNTDGTPIGQGLSLWLENDSIVYTSGGEESSTAKEEQYSVTEVMGSISTGGASKIVKVDVGNYSIKNLEAEFILAKYDAETDDWYYATDFPFSTSIDSKGEEVVSTTDHTISFENAVGEKTDLNGMIPSAEQAARINIKGSFNVIFEEDAIYKLIELKAPDGYIQTGFVEGESSVADMHDFTTYFAYMYEASSVSGELKASAGIPETTEVTMLNYLGSIEIPNIRPITIGAQKIWEQDPASAVNNPSVTLELWKSYLQNPSGVPNGTGDMSTGAVKVENAAEYFTDEIKNAENMTTSYGVGNENGSFTLTRQGESDYVWIADAIWENLPNGENGKPVYYYVKEIAYTIGGKTFTLDTDSESETYGQYVASDGSVYTDASGNSAEYRPLYTNNALGENGKVTVTNSRRFVIKKIWMRSDGTIMTNPPDQSVEIKLEGYNESTGEWQELILGSSGILSSNVNWEVEILQRYLTAYSRFRVSEVNPPYNYRISTIYELDGTVGTVSLINQSNAPTLGSLEVTKEWGDKTSHDPITVTLYQASAGIEEADLAEMSNGVMPDNAEEIGLKVVELAGFDSEVVLNDLNGWTYKWEDLPYADEYENRIYYYAVEKEVPEGYTVTYEKTNGTTDQTEKIVNSIPGALAINKNWVDTDGNPVTVGNGSEITVDVYTATVASSMTASATVPTTAATPAVAAQDSDTDSESLKIMAMGDSITFGYKGGSDASTVGGYRKYLYRDLTALGYDVDMVGARVGWNETSDDTNAMVSNKRSDGTGESITYDDRHEAVSGKTIEQLDEMISSDQAVANYTPDVILLMIGTNDVLQEYVTSTEDALYTKYKTLVDEIYSQNDSKTMKLYLITPPRIDSSRGYGYPSQTVADTDLANLKAAMETVCEERTEAGYYCKMIDVYDALYGDEDYASLLADYTHPNDDGYEAIGTYLAKQLDSYLTTGEAAPDDSEEEEEEELVIEEVNDPEALTALINQGVLVKKESITIAPDENGNWSTVLTDLPAHVEGDPNTLYVYYIVEKDGEVYNVVYKGNGKLISENGTTAIELTNTKEFEPIDITVEKLWPEAEELPEGVSIPSNVQIELYSSITQTENEADWTLDQTVTLTDAEWTYTFSDLHGGKYWYVKEVADGWTATYDGNGVTAEDGTITITNTIDTGSISVNKEWYKENTGNNSSVSLKVYRVAYDDNGDPIYEYQPRLSSTSAAFSLSRMRSALAAASSKETETEIDLSDVQLSLDNNIQVLAVERSITVTEYDFTDSRYWIDVYDLLGECTITGVTVSSTKSTWGGSDGGIAINPANYPYNWGNHTEVQYLSDEKVAISMEVNSDDNYIFINPWYGGLTSVVITYELAAEPFELDSAPSSLVAGDTGTITATGNESDIKWSSDKEDVAIVNSSGVITALSEGFVTITGQDGEDQSRRITASFSVSPFLINKGEPSVTLIEGGEKVPLSVNNQNGNVEWSSNNAAVSVENGVLTLKEYTTEEVVITANHGNGVTDTIIVNVQPAEITLEIDKTTLHKDGKATLTPSHDDVTYSASPEGVVLIEDDMVTAVGEGPVTITATRNGKSASVTINIAELAVNPVSGTYNINSSITLTLENVVDGIAGVISSDTGVVSLKSISGNTVTLEAIDEGEATITIIDGAGGEATATFTVVIQQASVNEPDIENISWLWNKTLTPGTSNDWYAELNNLPLTDGNGHTYTYYVVEELPDGANYYPIYYSETDGFTLENGENTSVLVTNKAEEVESAPAELPEAGGSGLKVYYVAGGMIMLLAAAGYILVKRRKYDTKNG